MHMCLILMLIKDLKCTTMGFACVMGVLIVGTLDSNCECALGHSACDSCGMHVTHTDNQYVEYPNVSVRKNIAEEYITCVPVSYLNKIICIHVIGDMRITQIKFRKKAKHAFW